MNDQIPIIGTSLFQAVPELVEQDLVETLKSIFRLKNARDVRAVAYLKSQKQHFTFSFNRISIEKEIAIMFLSPSSEHGHGNISDLSIKANESQLSNLADSMPQLVWIADEDGVVRYYNSQVRKFAGATQSDDGLWQWQGLIHPDDVRPTSDAWAKAVKDKSIYQMEHRIKMSDGQYRWHLSRALPNRGETGLKWYGTATDIQQLKDSQTLIRESEERFRIISDATPTIIWALTPEGSHRYLNKYALEYLGISIEKAIEMDWHPFIHPDDFDSTQLALSEAITQRKGYSKEHRLLRHDGVYRWFLSQGAPSYYENGELYGYVGSGIDIHEWKLAQTALQQNEEILENLVKERTLELQRSNRDLQQFAHVASHDLKEPLRKIKTFAFKLQNEFQNVLAERGNDLVKKIIHSGDRMTAMINGVLNYSSLQVREVKRQVIDLNRVIQDIENDLDLLIHEKQASINYAQLPEVNGHPDQVHQLFFNLIHNALKFSKPDVQVRIKITGQSITEPNGFIAFEIIDNGIGFNNEHAEQIFGAFIRLNSKDQYEGTGLGLAMCQRIIEYHGGTITASGQENGGAKFRFTLPGRHG